MKLSGLSCFLLLGALIAAGILSHCLKTSPDAGNTARTPLLPEKVIRIPATTAAPKPLSLRARYACVADASSGPDGTSGRILYSKDADKKAPMASTTKIMTAILVLESGRTDETVTASSHAAAMPRVRLGMRKGEKFRMSDLLYSLMLESHNDTAVAIAEHIGGSVQGFAEMMNKKAASLGMSSTHFVTPNGLDAKNHYSTASDMCRLAAHAIKNKQFLSLIRTKSHRFSDIRGKHTYSLTNRDAFLSYYDGALGVKTGFTGNAGYCFVGAARKNGITLTSCVLACGWPPDKSLKWTDTKKLMDFSFKNYTSSSLPLQNLSQVRIPVEDGLSPFVSIRQPAPVNTLSARFESITVRYDFPERLIAPVRSELPIGTVSYYLGDTLYKKEKIFPSEDIEKSGFSDTIGDVLHRWMRALYI